MNRAMVGGWIAALLVAAPALAQERSQHKQSSKSQSSKSQSQMGSSSQMGGQSEMGMGQRPQLQDKAPQDVISQIRQRTREYQQAWNTHDANRIATFFTDTATIVTPMDSAEGKDQIVQLAQRDQARLGRNAKVQLQVDSIREVTPDVAVADMRQTVSGMQASAMKMPAESHVTAVLKRQGSQWFAESIRAFPAPEGMGVGGAGSSSGMGNQPSGSSGSGSQDQGSGSMGGSGNGMDPPKQHHR